MFIMSSFSICFWGAMDNKMSVYRSSLLCLEKLNLFLEQSAILIFNLQKKIKDLWLLNIKY